MGVALTSHLTSRRNGRVPSARPAELEVVMWRGEPVIDREGRRKAATLLRSLASGRITNAKFADRWPVSPDSAVEEVYWAAWKLFSDLREYRLAGPDRLTKAERRVVARWVVFLRTDLPYSWPP